MTDEPRQPQDKYIVRFPDGLRDRLKEVAAENKRSLNAEIIARLEASFSMDAADAEYRALNREHGQLREKLNELSQMIHGITTDAAHARSIMRGSKPKP